MTPPPDAPTAVIALGGNALAPAGEKSTIYDQFRHTRESLGPIVDLARDGWNVCVVHGNGPQVGDELVRNEVARAEASPLPLGVLVAATAGWIGYMIQQSIENALRRARLDARSRHDDHAGAGRSRTTRRCRTRRSSSGRRCSPSAPTSCVAKGMW